MKITVEFETTSFDEAVAILRVAANRLDFGRATSFNLRDSNGGAVIGKVKVQPDS